MFTFELPNVEWREPPSADLAAPFAAEVHAEDAFESRAYSAAVGQIAAGLRAHELIGAITGAPRSGKSTLCRTLAESRHERAVVASLQAGRGDLLPQCLSEFGITSADHLRASLVPAARLLEAFRGWLDTIASLQVRVVILVDDAQRLTSDELDELLSLSTVAAASRTLIHIVLVGEPALQEILSRPGARAIRQRVARWHELGPLDVEEIGAYVERRLSAASERQPLLTWPAFGEDAIAAAARFSDGSFDTINTLCERSLTYARHERLPLVSASAVHQAARTMGLETPIWQQPRARAGAALALFIVIAGTIGWAVAHWPSVGTERSRPPSKIVSRSNEPSDRVAGTAGTSARVDDALRRASMLARTPDVQGLLALKDEVEAWRTTSAAQKDQTEALRQIDARLKEARQRQLTIDHELLLRQRTTAPAQSASRR